MSQLYNAPTKPFALFAPIRGVRRIFDDVRARRALAEARRAADREVLRNRLPSLRLSWRVAELVTPKNRLELAHTLRRTVSDCRQRYLISASPVNRPAVRAEAERLLALGDRLADLDHPVDARGILLVQHLLTDGSSPLYDRTRPEALPFYIDAALDALEPR
jgi:hypothetical protein